MNDQTAIHAVDTDEDDPRNHPEGCTCIFCIPGY